MQRRLSSALPELQQTPSGMGWIQVDILEVNLEPPKTSVPCYIFFSGPIPSDTNTDRGDRGAVPPSDLKP